MKRRTFMDNINEEGIVLTKEEEEFSRTGKVNARGATEQSSGPTLGRQLPTKQATKLPTYQATTLPTQEQTKQVSWRIPLSLWQQLSDRAHRNKMQGLPLASHQDILNEALRQWFDRNKL